MKIEGKYLNLFFHETDSSENPRIWAECNLTSRKVFSYKKSLHYGGNFNSSDMNLGLLNEGVENISKKIIENLNINYFENPIIEICLHKKEKSNLSDKLIANIHTNLKNQKIRMFYEPKVMLY
ncbi:MAG: hypothetical protein KJ566_03250 [Nanoarchaeota archaeon]|nr:hypothetical protein [Nanoarchaeota archaeon]